MQFDGTWPIDVVLLRAPTRAQTSRFNNCHSQQMSIIIFYLQKGLQHATAGFFFVRLLIRFSPSITIKLPPRILPGSYCHVPPLGTARLVWWFWCRSSRLILILAPWNPGTYQTKLKWALETWATKSLAEKTQRATARAAGRFWISQLLGGILKS